MPVLLLLCVLLGTGCAFRPPHYYVRAGLTACVYQTSSTPLATHSASVLVATGAATLYECLGLVP